MSVTHVPAQCIVVSGQLMRQRCAWCGEILLDYDFQRTAVAGSEWHPPAEFPTGRLVTHDGPMWLVLDEDVEPPEDTCLFAHPELTL